MKAGVYLMEKIYTFDNLHSGMNYGAVHSVLMNQIYI